MKNEPLSIQEPLLQIQNLTTEFRTDLGVVRAVDGLTLNVPARETIGIVGESGCGKSTIGLSIMRLISDPPGKISSGQILFEGRDLLQLGRREMRGIRGNRISMIFQEPMTSLNPVRRVGDAISEVIALHLKLSRKDAWDKAIEALDRVRIPSPSIRVNDFPHQMSGGMRQRIMIALAISCNPTLIIADEPTTALDVTIQAQILSLLNQIKEELGTSVALVTHNLGVIAENAQQVAVMYAGKLIERADTKNLFDHPLHPYTQGLMASVPRLDKGRQSGGRLKMIPGAVPNLLNLPPGCKFAERCPQTVERCRTEEPDLITPHPDHVVRCWRYA
jgi:oligopeptide/dipeptide ABC transporter ATP-binding protein